MSQDGKHEGDPEAKAELPDDRPLALLAGLSFPASSRFVPRIRASIERRMLLSQLAAGIWFAPLAVLLEFVCVGLGLFSVRTESSPRRGSRRA